MKFDNISFSKGGKIHQIHCFTYSMDDLVIWLNTRGYEHFKSLDMLSLNGKKVEGIFARNLQEAKLVELYLQNNP